MNFAFLGLGQMGAGVAARLLAHQHSLAVWNRSKGPEAALVEQGATTAVNPAEAVRHADTVFTMLTDDAAIRAVVFGGTEDTGTKHDGILSSMKPGAVHITLSTISVALARELTSAHQAHGQKHLGAPVFGRPNVAAEGKLWLAVAGDPTLVDQLRPALASFSRGMSVVGAEPWQAHALKLGGNFMITASIQMLSEAFVYAQSQGIDPGVFLEAVNSALFQSAFIGNYGKTILNPPETPGATVSLGIKDTRLFREAAHSSGIQSPLADYLADRLTQAEAAGLQKEDWAVGQYKVAQRNAKP